MVLSPAVHQKYLNGFFKNKNKKPGITPREANSVGLGGWGPRLVKILKAPQVSLTGRHF